MTLTNVERFQKERDQLLLLTAELMALRADENAPGYPESMTPTLERLDEFKLNAQFDDHRKAASAAVRAAIKDVMEDALADLGNAVRDLGPLGEELALARATAETGKRELTLPRIATVSSMALGSLEPLLKAMEGFDDDDLGASVATMQEAIDKLKEVIKTLPNA